MDRLSIAALLIKTGASQSLINAFKVDARNVKTLSNLLTGLYRYYPDLVSRLIHRMSGTTPNLRNLEVLSKSMWKKMDLFVHPGIEKALEVLFYALMNIQNAYKQLHAPVLTREMLIKLYKYYQVEGKQPKVVGAGVQIPKSQGAKVVYKPVKTKELPAVPERKVEEKIEILEEPELKVEQKEDVPTEVVGIAPQEQEFSELSEDVLSLEKDGWTLDTKNKIGSVLYHSFSARYPTNIGKVVGIIVGSPALAFIRAWRANKVAQLMAKAVKLIDDPDLETEEVVPVYDVLGAPIREILATKLYQIGEASMDLLEFMAYKRKGIKFKDLEAKMTRIVERKDEKAYGLQPYVYYKPDVFQMPSAEVVGKMLRENKIPQVRNIYLLPPRSGNNYVESQDGKVQRIETPFVEMNEITHLFEANNLGLQLSLLQEGLRFKRLARNSYPNSNQPIPTFRPNFNVAVADEEPKKLILQLLRNTEASKLPPGIKAAYMDKFKSLWEEGRKFVANHYLGSTGLKPMLERIQKVMTVRDSVKLIKMWYSSEDDVYFKFIHGLIQEKEVFKERNRLLKMEIKEAMDFGDEVKKEKLRRLITVGENTAIRHYIRKADENSLLFIECNKTGLATRGLLDAYRRRVGNAFPINNRFGCVAPDLNEDYQLISQYMNEVKNNRYPYGMMNPPFRMIRVNPIAEAGPLYAQGTKREDDPAYGGDQVLLTQMITTLESQMDFWSGFDFSVLCDVKQKNEIQEAGGAIRCFYPFTSGIKMPFNFIFNNVYSPSPNWFNHATSNHLLHFSQFGGGMDRLITRLASRLGYTCLCYADNWYIFYNDGKTIKMLSLDGSKMEGSHTTLGVTLEMMRIVEEYFGNDAFTVPPPNAKAGRLNPLSCGWHRALVEVYPVIATKAVGILGQHQIPIPGLASGVQGTAQMNTILSSPTTSVCERVLNSKKVDFDKAFDVVSAITNTVGVVLKNSEGVSNDIVADLTKMGDICKMDLLGFDCTRVKISDQLNFICPVLARERMLGILFFHKFEFRGNKEQKATLNIYTRYVTATTAYIVGGWIEPEMAALCKLIAVTALNDLSKRAEAITQEVRDQVLIELPVFNELGEETKEAIKGVITKRIVPGIAEVIAIVGRKDRYELNYNGVVIDHVSLNELATYFNKYRMVDHYAQVVKKSVEFNTSLVPDVKFADDGFKFVQTSAEDLKSWKQLVKALPDDTYSVFAQNGVRVKDGSTFMATNDGKGINFIKAPYDLVCYRIGMKTNGLHNSIVIVPWISSKPEDMTKTLATLYYSELGMRGNLSFRHADYKIFATAYADDPEVKFLMSDKTKQLGMSFRGPAKFHKFSVASQVSKLPKTSGEVKMSAHREAQTKVATGDAIGFSVGNKTFTSDDLKKVEVFISQLFKPGANVTIQYPHYLNPIGIVEKGTRTLLKPRPPAILFLEELKRNGINSKAFQERYYLKFKRKLPTRIYFTEDPFEAYYNYTGVQPEERKKGGVIVARKEGVIKRQEKGGKEFQAVKMYELSDEQEGPDTGSEFGN